MLIKIVRQCTEKSEQCKAMKAKTIITESKDLRIKTFNYGNRYYVKG